MKIHQDEFAGIGACGGVGEAVGAPVVGLQKANEAYRALTGLSMARLRRARRVT